MPDFIRIPNHKVFHVTKIVTVLYFEYTKNFKYPGEKHDFWEFVYIDKEQLVCTAEERSFLLHGGELIFHRPNEFHNLAADNVIEANASVVTFECGSKYMEAFVGRIFKLNAAEKRLLSRLMQEGMSAFTPLSSAPRTTA